VLNFKIITRKFSGHLRVEIAFFAPKKLADLMSGEGLSLLMALCVLTWWNGQTNSFGLFYNGNNVNQYCIHDLITLQMPFSYYHYFGD
jgi:hypothetical protein